LFKNQIGFGVTTDLSMPHSIGDTNQARSQTMSMDFLTKNSIVKSGFVRIRRRIQDLSPAERARAKEDHAAVAERFPFLAEDAFAKAAADAENRLNESHAHYIANVGHPVHAASIELAVFMDVICNGLNPTRVADLGSGFTSFVVRSFAKGSTSGVDVSSVDDHPEWLQKTKDYLTGKDVSAQNVLLWDEFSGSDPAPFDLVLHDMGMMDFRAQTLERVLQLTRPGGVVILDDMHKPEYRTFALQTLEQKGLEHYSLRALTHDNLTRYAYLVIT